MAGHRRKMQQVLLFLDQSMILEEVVVEECLNHPRHQKEHEQGMGTV